METQKRPLTPFKTRLIPTDRLEAVSEAVTCVKQGQVIILPTDTVYGVGCDAFDEAAIREIYRIKERPLHKAIPILLANITDLPAVVSRVPPIAQTLLAQYWPGPLTLILPKHPDLPEVISPNDGVAVRIPDHALTRAIIQAVGGAMAVTSANRSGQPPALTAVQALADFDGLVTAILDDGPAPAGIASTIVDCTTDVPCVIRKGPLTDLISLN